MERRDWGNELRKIHFNIEHSNRYMYQLILTWSFINVYLRNPCLWPNKKERDKEAERQRERKKKKIVSLNGRHQVERQDAVDM